MAAGHHGGDDDSSDSMESIDSEEERQILEKIRKAKEKWLARLPLRAEEALERPPPPDNQPRTRAPIRSGPPPNATMMLVLEHRHPVQATTT